LVEKLKKRNRGLPRGGQDDESSGKDSSRSKSLARGKAMMPKGTKRSFSEISKERDDGRAKRAADMMDLLRARNEERISLLTEREKTAQEKEKTEQEREKGCAGEGQGREVCGKERPS
jgi:hypothetical protein